MDLRGLPSLSSQADQFELHMLIVRLRQRNDEQAFRGRTDLLVNVGAGGTGRQGWVNIDAFSAKGITCLGDARKRFPLPNGSAKVLFTEHFFEHLDYSEEAPRFLSECHCVLTLAVS